MSLASGASFDLAADVGAGNTVVVCVAHSGAPSPPTLSGLGVTTWAQIGALQTGGGFYVSFWYGLSGGGSKTLTVTCPGGTYNAHVTEFRAVDHLVSYAVSTQTGTTAAQSLTATAGQLAYAAVVARATITAFTGLAHDYNTGTGLFRWSQGGDVAYSIDPGAGGTYTPSWTLSTAVDATVGEAIFAVRPAAASLALGPLAVTATSSITAPTITGAAVLNIGPVQIVAADHTTTRLATVAVRLGPLKLAALGGNIGPNAWPVPNFRGRWRLTLHARQFAPATLMSTIIAELPDARGRQLVQAWNTPATMTFTLDGRSPAAALVEELQHDVVAWRWDDQTGSDIAVFRGVIAQSEDQINEDAHTVTYTCHDYAAVLQRRLLTATYTVTARDQDLIVGDLLGLASSAHTSSGTALTPASYLPLALTAVTPAGVLRGLSGRTRDRTYYGSQNIGAAVDDLSKIINGFDYDVVPSAVDATDSLRVFYPQQGVTRTDGIALQYGSTISSLTRLVSSGDYANYVRVLGNKTSSAPTPQFYSEATAAGTATSTAGLWMLADDATDVTIQSTLDEKAAGELTLDAVLVPHYTLGLRPGAYEWGQPNMGDVVPLIVQTGRLDVNTTVRVLGITYDIGDDGQEDVTLVVSRPPPSFRKLFTKSDQDIRALARR